MAVVIQSGNSTDVATVDAISKAIRVTNYDPDGTALTRQPSYRASTITTVSIPAGTAPFFVFYGSASKTIRIQRIQYVGTIATAAANAVIICEKYNGLPSGGVAAPLTQVPLNSMDLAGSASLLQNYTTAPTSGAVVGTLEVQRALHSITGAVVTYPVLFDFRGTSTELPAKSLTLNGTTEGVGLRFAATLTNVVQGSIWVEWIET